MFGMVMPSLYLLVLWGSIAAIFIIIIFFLLEVDILNKKRSFKFIALLVVVCVLLGYMVFLYIDSQKQIVSEQKMHIESVNSFKSYNIQNYINYQLSRLEKLAENSEIRKFVKEYIQTGLNSQEYLESAEKELAGFDGSVSVLSVDGIILVSSMLEEKGLDYSEYKDKLENPKADYFLIYYDQLLKEKMLAVVHPIIEGENVLGYVAETMNLEILGELAMSPYEYNSDYKMETFIIDKDGILLTPSKFAKNDSGSGVFIQEIKSLIADKCKEQLAGSNADSPVSIYEYVNHRGEKVLGAFSIIKPSQWCLITEFNSN